MITYQCRICGNASLKKSLEIERAPATIQNLPTTKDDSYGKVIQLPIYECKYCGLIQLSDKVIVPYYKEVIRSSSVSKDMRGLREEQYSMFVGKYLDQKSRYIEFGCGRGEYLGIMSQYLKDSIGVEYSEDNVNYCRSHSLKVSKGFDSFDNLTQDSFEAFGIFNFLEHVPKPIDYLKKISLLLRSEAVGLIEVPNFSIMIDSGNICDFSCEHLSYFTKSTLELALNMSGFEIVDFNILFHEHILSATVKKRRSLMTNNFQLAVNQLNKKIQEITKNRKRSEIAIWGAGHQSLTTILASELFNKVGHIVDSAPYKQNCYVPGTDLKISAPSILIGKDISLLFINASGYNEEVTYLAKNLYGNSLNIYLIDNMSIVEVQNE